MVPEDSIAEDVLEFILSELEAFYSLVTRGKYMTLAKGVEKAWMVSETFWEIAILEEAAQVREVYYFMGVEEG